MADTKILKEEKRYGAYPNNSIIKGQTYTEMIFAEMLKNQARKEIKAQLEKMGGWLWLSLL